MKIRDNVKKIIIVFITLVCSVLLIVFAGPIVVRGALYLFGIFSPFILKILRFESLPVNVRPPYSTFAVPLLFNNAQFVDAHIKY